MDELKRSLVMSLTPVRRLSAPHIQFLKFFSVVLIYLGLMLLLFKPINSDVARYRTLTFLLELFAILIAISVAGIGALRLSIPGYVKGIGEKCFIIGSFLLWPVFLIIEAPHEGMPPSGPDYHCARFIVITTVIFAPIFLFMLMRGASTSPRWTGLVGMMTISIVGALVLHFICPGSAFSHLFFWHFLPTAVIPVVFISFYNKLFKF